MNNIQIYCSRKNVAADTKKKRAKRAFQLSAQSKHIHNDKGLVSISQNPVCLQDGSISIELQVKLKSERTKKLTGSYLVMA